MVLSAVWRRISGHGESDGAEAGARGRFALARRHGYDPVGVDEFVSRVEALPDTPDGRQLAAELSMEVRFHLAHRNGYEPVAVDAYIDQIIDRARKDRSSAH